MEEQIDDPLTIVRRQLIERMHKHLDSNISYQVIGSIPSAHKMIAYAMAHDLPVLPLIHLPAIDLPNPKTIRMGFQELSESIDRLRDEMDSFNSKNRISALEDLMWITDTLPQVSRRGRNIKPDTSRKARYSTPRK